MKWTAVKPTPKVFGSAEAYEEWYAGVQRTQVAVLHLDGIYAVPCCRARCDNPTAPCGCGTSGCRGYYMLGGVVALGLPDTTLLVLRSTWEIVRQYNAPHYADWLRDERDGMIAFS